MARKAAKALNLAVCAISRPKLIELAPRIPVGRLHAQGKAFIPYIKQALFDELQGANNSDLQLHKLTFELIRQKKILDDLHHQQRRAARAGKILITREGRNQEI